MSENTATIDLHSFCADTDEPREWLRSPFSLGEFSYATNGVYAVRVGRRPEIPVLDGMPSKAAASFDKILVPALTATFESVADIVLPMAQETHNKQECDSCEGRGFEHECSDCTCKCLACDGTGRKTITKKISVDFLGGIYRLPFLRKILALPNVELATLPRGDIDQSDQSEPARFRFDGGLAALCLCRSRLDRHVEAEAAR